MRRLPVPQQNGVGPFADEPWRVGHLDSELRYTPVVKALPPKDRGPICEIGSGPAGIASWTDHQVIGIDPGQDDRHGHVRVPPNMRRIDADGTALPLDDGSVAAAIAVDTFEHMPAKVRGPVIKEMRRVTAKGGKVIVMGPSGDETKAAETWLRDRIKNGGREIPWAMWLDEHVRYGLPTTDELVGHLEAAGVSRIYTKTVFDLRLWRIMHLDSIGQLPTVRDPFYGLIWRPFAAIARRYARGPRYRSLVVAEV